MPQVNSPNWCFAKHGYQVEREGYHRTVYSPEGDAVLIRAGYDEELSFCREKGFLVSE